ncbi:hypothetical protein QUF80_18145 [Desulfococcaceae bacterium HSG8]|nr:hypothetical protein [Desulfococcaceae bacterium HSG8]
MMFFSGMVLGKNEDSATHVIIKKRLKNVKKQYHLEDIMRFPPGTGYSEIESHIIKTYNDRKFIINKRVFSQDRRPAKSVRMYPTVIAGFTGTDTTRIDALRKKKIPVEGIAVYDEKKWRKEEYGQICLGNNYYVPGGELLRNLVRVFQQGRLVIEDHIPFAELLSSELTHLSLTEKLSETKHTGIISALSLPVWFCENIRVIRRY